MKRMFAVVVVLIMVLSLVACQPIGTGTTQTTSGTQAPTAGTSESQAVQPSGKIFSDDVELRIIVGSHASYPYDENWKIWQYVKEALGGNVIIEPIMDSWDTKISLLMASI